MDVAETLLSLAGLGGGTAGRNLLGAPIRPAPIYGMRRVFRPGTREIRTDGKAYLLPEFLFFCAGPAPGSLWIGNSGGPGKIRETQQEMFAHVTRIEEMIRSHPAEDDTLDVESRRGLEALGYLEEQPRD